MAKLDITVETQDGKVKAGVFAPPKPATGERAGIIYYMDAFGPRPATDQMAGLELAKINLQRDKKAEAITILHKAASIQPSGIAYNLIRDML